MRGATPPWTKWNRKKKGGETLTRSLMSASMFTPTERPSTKLAFVLFIRNVLRLRGFGHLCDRRCGRGSSNSRHCNCLSNPNRRPELAGMEAMRLSDTDGGMMMDWTYAKWNSFDHAFWWICGSKRRKPRVSCSLVLAASLILWESSWVSFDTPIYSALIRRWL